MKIRPPIVLTFAASDPTSGAGLQADLLTIAALGCHPVSVLTGFTVQDTNGVSAFHALDAAYVAAQARCLLADVPVATIKLGVIGSAANCMAIAEVLAQHREIPVVLDPVLASARGDALADAMTIEALRARLLPLATVATPNSVEARRLVARAAAEDAVRPLAQCAEELLALGCAHVLVTGAHEDAPEVVNTLYGARGVLREDRWTRLEGSFHGSGCTLASALAAALANGLDVADAAGEAQEYTWRALDAGFRAGGGQWLPDRFFWAREMTDAPPPEPAP
jgi:hydroxymethylpyrimidine/phosphomethylpyrimidine kinase